MRNRLSSVFVISFSAMLSFSETVSVVWPLAVSFPEMLSGLAVFCFGESFGNPLITFLDSHFLRTSRKKLLEYERVCPCYCLLFWVFLLISSLVLEILIYLSRQLVWSIFHFLDSFFAYTVVCLQNHIWILDSICLLFLFNFHSGWMEALLWCLRLLRYVPSAPRIPAC